MKLELLDTTLRDGAQTEGVSFSITDRRVVADTLDRLGIPLIECGIPASTKIEADFLKSLAARPLNSALPVAFGMTCRPDVKAEEDAAVKALLGAKTPIVTLLGKASAMQVKKVLRTSPRENERMVRETIAYCTSKKRRVIFDAEHFFDGFREDPKYALRIVCAAAEAGADTVCLCDTNGATFPDAIRCAVSAAKEALTRANLAQVAVGIHCHDDCGLAVANTMAAAEAGATHIQGSVAAFGERCGNANLATFIGNMQLKLHYECIPAERLALLTPAVRRIAETANFTMRDEMPYVGRRAFAHKGGLHIDAMNKWRGSFEHIAPEIVGNKRRYLISQIAGRAALVERIKNFIPNIEKDSPVITRIYKHLKLLEEQGYQFEGAEASFEMLVRRIIGGAATARPFFRLHHFRVMASNSGLVEATIKISVNGEERITAAEGHGPVNALDLALRRALSKFYPSINEIRMLDHKARVIDATASTASITRVLIESTDGHRVWTTVGVSEDIIKASWSALLDTVEFKLIHDASETI